jgi:hypothetical protein
MRISQKQTKPQRVAVQWPQEKNKGAQDAILRIVQLTGCRSMLQGRLKQVFATYMAKDISKYQPASRAWCAWS